MPSLAVYKGKGGITNSSIRLWTGSEYSHCEIVVNGLCYSSSAMDGGVRSKLIDLDSGHWDLIEIPWADDDSVLDYFNKTDYQTYGWVSLVTSQLFNLGLSGDHSQFCSEWCAAALGIPNESAYNPQTLFEIISFINQVR